MSDKYEHGEWCEKYKASALDLADCAANHLLEIAELRAEIERLRIAVSEATVDEVEDYIQSKEAEIERLRAQVAS